MLRSIGERSARRWRLAGDGGGQADRRRGGSGRFVDWQATAAGKREPGERRHPCCDPDRTRVAMLDASAQAGLDHLTLARARPQTEPGRDQRDHHGHGVGHAPGADRLDHEQLEVGEVRDPQRREEQQAVGGQQRAPVPPAPPQPGEDEQDQREPEPEEGHGDPQDRRVLGRGDGLAAVARPADRGLPQRPRHAQVAGHERARQRHQEEREAERAAEGPPGIGGGQGVVLADGDAAGSAAGLGELGVDQGGQLGDRP